MVILETAVAASDSNSAPIVPNAARELTLQVSFLGSLTGTVAISGRLSPLAPWVPLQSVTQNALISIGHVNYVKAELSGPSGEGSVLVELSN